MLGTIEIAVTIIAACIPVLRVLLRDVQKTYRSKGGSNHITKPDGCHGSAPPPHARGLRLGTQLFTRSEAAPVPALGIKAVVMQEKSWAITYSPASGYGPSLDDPEATTLPGAAGARRSMRSLPSPQSRASFRSAEGPVSPVSIPACSPSAPPSARRHTIDWRVDFNLSPSAVNFDDDLTRYRDHGENERADALV